MKFLETRITKSKLNQKIDNIKIINNKNIITHKTITNFFILFYFSKIRICLGSFTCKLERPIIVATNVYVIFSIRYSIYELLSYL